jgi:hypothetical protein
MTKIAAPRIGEGNGYFVAGWISWAMMLLLAFISTAGWAWASALASLLAAFGAGCFAVGFWTKLFGALERRLIDIQIAVTPADDGAPDDEPSIITGR